MAWSIKQTAAVAGSLAGCSIVAWKVWKHFDLRNKNRAISGDRTVLVLGAGFAGFNVAQELARLLPGENNGRITLLDQNNFLLFTPMLTEVAGGELDPRHIVASPRRLSPRIKFEQGVVHDIDLAKKSVVLDIGRGGDRRTLNAGQLVIALGSVSNFHGIPGLEEHSLGIKSVDNAVSIRNRVLECLELANWERDASIRREILSFVVGGGGYTGVETMAAMNDLVRMSAKDYPNVPPDDITTLLIESGDRLLTELSPDLAAFAQKKLEEHGVTVLLKTKIASAAGNFVELEHGKRIPTRTLIWAGGVAPNPLVKKLDCKRGKHGGIVVDQCCAVPGRPGVWAIGDCAEIPKAESKGWYAPTAQNATREGVLVAQNIVAVLRGQPTRPFTYQPIGELALVGRHSGVARLYGRQFSGLLAWAMWRAVYISKMPGMAHRIRILLDWMLDFVFGRSTASLRSELRPKRNNNRVQSQEMRSM